MGKYSSQLIGSGTKQYKESLEAGRAEKDIKSLSLPAGDLAPGMFDIFTGASRETPQTRELPEFRETKEARTTKGTDSILNTMKMTAGLMFTLDDQSSKDIIQENIPGATFEEDEKGNTIIDIDGKKSVLNKPGWSGQDSVRALTQVLSFVTPAKMAGMASKIITKMGIGAAGAGVTEAGIQEIEKLAGSKEDRTLGRIVGATVMGGLAEGIGGGVRGLRESRQAKKLQVAKADVSDVAGSVAEARTAEKATGIDLAFPQKTAVPAQLEEMSFVAQLPAGTKKSMQFLRKQNVQASEGVEAYLNQLAPADVMTKGAEKFRTASQLAVGAKKQIRSEAVSPIYKKAFQDKSPVNPSEVVDLITSKMDDFPEGGEVAKTLGKIKGLLGKQTKEILTDAPAKEGSIQTGKPLSYYYSRHKEAAPDMGATFAQDIEPSGKYIASHGGKRKIEGFEYGITDFKNPLVLEHKTTGHGGWKTDLSEMYDGKTGKDLSKAVIADGYDGIVTVDKGRISEGVMLKKGTTGKPPKTEKQPTIKKLHNAKLEIDQMISSYGENSLGNTTKKEVLDIKNSLLSYMDEVSPDYKAAREKFAELSPDVTKIQESIIGKMAEVSDVQLKTISRRIFDPAETNVQTIMNAKKVINSVDPDAWDGLLRVEIERRMGAVASDISEAGIGAVENVPGQLYRAIFKPSKQRNVLYAALDGEQKLNLKYLETALKRASLGRPGGSQTAGREEIKKRLRGGMVQGIRNFFKKPIDTLVETGEDAAFNQRVRDLSSVLFSPEYKIQMKKIRKMNPNTSASLKAFTQLLNDAGE